MPNAANDPIATLAELRALRPLSDDTEYPDDLVLLTRDAVIDALEGREACNVSFVRREFTEAFADPAVMRMIALSQHRDPAISALTVNGIAVDLTDPAILRVGRGGLVSRRWGGFGNTAEVTYTAGYDTPPGRVQRAVRMLTRDWLVEQLNDTLPSRATSWTAGENTYRLITAGVAGALFDLPEANAVVKQYRE